MYKNKYLKNKIKYFQHKKLVQTGGTANVILLDGTSSSGKTTISKFYEEHGYKHIAFDDYNYKGRIEMLRELPNEYITKQKLRELGESKIRELMYEESKKYPKVIFDDIDQKILIFDKNIYTIIVYASLRDLARNIISRKLTEPRSIFVFDQYVKKFIKSDSEKDSIDIINKKDFIEDLKLMKYEFESESDLLNFATKIFSSMDINDDADHYIKLRDTLKYNYIINTRGKEPTKIYAELKTKTDEYSDMNHRNLFQPAHFKPNFNSFIKIQN